MLTELEESLDGLDWESARTAVGELVGLSEPLPAPALRRAMVEDKFCLALLAFRGNQSRLQELVSQPGTRAYELPQDGASAPSIEPEDTEPSGVRRSAVGLAAEAGKAVTRWAASGFRTVDEETYERRTSACAACPELVEPPVKLVYKVALVGVTDDRVCGACGCVAARKARLVTEQCPRRDPADAELSRWGEPYSSD